MNDMTIRSRASDLMSHCPEAVLAALVARSERALQGINGLFRSEPQDGDPPLMDEIQEMRDVLADIERAALGEQ